jgi:hypothetical protein
MSPDDVLPTNEIQKERPAGNAGQAGNGESTIYSIIKYDNKFKQFSPSFEYIIRSIHHPFINSGGE